MGATVHCGHLPPPIRREGRQAKTQQCEGPHGPWLEREAFDETSERNQTCHAGLLPTANDSPRPPGARPPEKALVRFLGWAEGGQVIVFFLLGGKRKRKGLCEEHLELSIAPGTLWGFIGVPGSSSRMGSE